MQGVAQKSGPVMKRPQLSGAQAQPARARGGAGNHFRQAEASSHRTNSSNHSSAGSVSPANLLLRSCACGKSASGSCDECKKKKKLLRSSDMPAPTAVPSIVNNVLSGSGRPLDAATRTYMEGKFGQEFGDVRIHDDARAAESARSVNATAYTVGQDIVFDSGRYAPDTTAGRELLAHELAHTVQQRGLQRSLESVVMPSAEESRRLETEADTVAQRALSGVTVPAIGGSLDAPRLSRTARSWSGRSPRTFTANITHPQLAGQLSVDVTAVARDPEANGVAFLLSAFYVPVHKRFALSRYITRAAEGALEAHLTFDGGSVRPFSQGRDAPSTLRDLWTQRMNWAPAQRHLLWHLAGGCPAPASPPATGAAPAMVATASATANPNDFFTVPSRECDTDHVTELQVGGTNVPDNLFVLDSEWNRPAGTQFTWQMLSQLGRRIRDEFYPNDPRPEEITLSFRDNITIRGNPAQTGVPPENPQVYDRNRCLREVFGGRATQCWQVDLCAQRMTAADMASVPGAGAAAAAGTRIFPLRIAESTVNVTSDQRHATNEIMVPFNAGLATTAAPFRPENAPAADLISGLELLKMTIRPERSRQRNTFDLVEGRIDQRAITGRQRNNPPPSIEELGDQGAPIRLNRTPLRGATEGPAPNDTEGRLAIVNPRAAVRFHYPFLSEAQMTLDLDPVRGLSGRGTLRPSIPLINRYPMNLEFGQGHMRAFYGTVPRGGRPIPGGRLTEMSLGAELMPEFRPVGRLAMEFGPAARPLGNLTLEASADESGLVFTGDLFVQIPGTDRSQGHVEYRNNQWSGFVVVESSKIRLPGFQRGELRVDFNPDGSVRPSGTLELLVLGNPVMLRASYERNRMVLLGEATIRVPNLQPVNVSLRHDGEHLTGSVRTGVTIAGLTGTVLVNYRDGDVSGEGTLSLQRGRANGNITLRISPAGDLTGRGTVTVRLTDNLVGTVGIEKPERGPVRVTGELAFPNPIVLFRAIERRHTLFERTVEFGIPGLSIPVVNVGVVATITGSLGVGYGFGPGTLQDIRVGVGFNPLEENTDFALDAGARLSIPAHAELILSIRAGAGLSAGIARITGGITGRGTVGLEGGFLGTVEFHYRNNSYALGAEARIAVRPVFSLGLDADVTAEVGAFGYVAARWQKVWNLYNFRWGADAEFGMIASLRYSTQDGFTLPSPDNIQWIIPNIDTGSILRGLFSNARGTERDLE
jgi:Domain of unknown function (DUF4157)